MTARRTPATRCRLPACRRVATASVLLLIASACAVDAPVVEADPSVSPTSLETARLTGRATGAETVEITRTSPDEASEEWIAPVAHFDGRWSIDVALTEDAENHFRLIPVDSSGRRGEAASLTIVHEPVRAHSISLLLDKEVITVERGAVEARILLHHPEPAVSLLGLPVDLFVGDEAEARIRLEADRLGQATSLIEGLYLPGVVELRAVSGTASATAQVEVVRDPLAAASVEVSLLGGAESEIVDGILTVGLDAEVEVSVTVRNAIGEVLDEVVYDIACSAPGSRIEDGIVRGLSSAGSHLVVVALRGSPVYGEAGLRVLPGEADSLSLDLSHASVLVGEPVRFRLDARDRHGNPISDPSTIVVEAGPSAEIDRQDDLLGVVRFGRAGAGDVTASLALAEETLVSRRGVSVGELGDVSASVSIVAPGRGEILSGDPGVAIKLAGEAAAGVAELLLEVSGSDGDREVFRAPISGGPLGAEIVFNYSPQSQLAVLGITASLVDRDGRRVSSRTLPVLVHSALVVAEGYEMLYIAGGPGSRLDRPTGIAVLGPTRALVANFDASDIVSVDLETGEIVDFAELPASPRDIARDPATGHFISPMDDGNLARLDESGALLSGQWAQIADPHCLVVDQEGVLLVLSATARRIVGLPASAVEDPAELFAIDCGEALVGAPRGIAIESSGGGHRSLLISTAGSPGLHRCTSSVNDGRDEGLLLGSDLLDGPRQIIPMESGAALVADRWTHSVFLMQEDPADPEASWSSTEVVAGVRGAYGLKELGPGRILVGSVVDGLLLELRLP